MAEKPKLKIGLALGSGSARGLCHIGIINELAENGVVPSVICGSSIGAMVGASWITGRLKELEEWAMGMTRFKAARFLNINTGFNGFLDTSRYSDFLDEYVADDELKIEDHELAYGAIATEFSTARERWMTSGSLKEAVWASMALPGLFPPKRYDGSWLIDGGLVNPVPISLCHALGANFTIAVNLNGDLVDKHFEALQRMTKRNGKDKEGNRTSGIAGRLSRLTHDLLPGSDEKEPELHPPGLITTIASAINITQDRITRSRMAGDPPDLLLAPRLAHIGLLDLYRAAEAIEEGRHCVRKLLPEIERIAQMDVNSTDELSVDEDSSDVDSAGE